MINMINDQVSLTLSDKDDNHEEAHVDAAPLHVDSALKCTGGQSIRQSHDCAHNVADIVQQLITTADQTDRRD